MPIHLKGEGNLLIVGIKSFLMLPFYQLLINFIESTPNRLLDPYFDTLRQITFWLEIFLIEYLI